MQPQESAITRSGTASDSAPITRSTIGWQTTMRWMQAAGHCAFTSVPAGATIRIGRLHPSVFGIEGSVMQRASGIGDQR
jgi:hypothetical protein